MSVTGAICAIELAGIKGKFRPKTAIAQAIRYLGGIDVAVKVTPRNRQRDVHLLSVWNPFRLRYNIGTPFHVSTNSC